MQMNDVLIWKINETCQGFIISDCDSKMAEAVVVRVRETNPMPVTKPTLKIKTEDNINSPSSKVMVLCYR